MFRGKSGRMHGYPNFTPSSRSINVSQGFLVKLNGITNDLSFFFFFHDRVIISRVTRNYLLKNYILTYHDCQVWWLGLLIIGINKVLRNY